MTTPRTDRGTTLLVRQMCQGATGQVADVVQDGEMVLRMVRVAVLSLALLAGACSTDSSESREAIGGGLPVVVDTDMGFDDVRALMLLAQNPEIDLLAVTIAGAGLGRCPVSAANAKAILESIGQPDVPVSCGPRGPISGFNLAPTAWRDAADALAGMDLPAPSDFGENDAPELLAETISGAVEPVTVLTLGPLTNLAIAIGSNPAIIDNIERLVIMGGALDVGGNTLSFASPAVAEFNFWFDPVAVDQVFSTSVDITLVPLDATNDVPITPMLYDTLAAAADHSTPAAALMRDYVAENPFTGGIYHWDDLAAAALTDPDLVEIEERTVRVRTDAGPQIGQLIIDPEGRSVQVAVSADRIAFENRFSELFGLSGLDTSAFVADAIVTYDGSDCRYDGPDALPAELVIEIRNTSGRTILGVAAGVYKPGATVEALAAYESSNPSGPPWFMTLDSVAPLPAATTSYWRFNNSPDTTLSCVFEIGSAVELAGPRLAAKD